MIQTKTSFSFIDILIIAWKAKFKILGLSALLFLGEAYFIFKEKAGPDYVFKAAATYYFPEKETEFENNFGYIGKLIIESEDSFKAAHPESNDDNIATKVQFYKKLQGFYDPNLKSLVINYEDQSPEKTVAILKKITTHLEKKLKTDYSSIEFSKVSAPHIIDQEEKEIELSSKSSGKVFKAIFFPIVNLIVITFILVIIRLTKNELENYNRQSDEP